MSQDSPEENRVVFRPLGGHTAPAPARQAHASERALDAVAPTASIGVPAAPAPARRSAPCMKRPQWLTTPGHVARLSAQIKTLIMRGEVLDAYSSPEVSTRRLRTVGPICKPRPRGESSRYHVGAGAPSGCRMRGTDRSACIGASRHRIPIGYTVLQAHLRVDTSGLL